LVVTGTREKVHSTLVFPYEVLKITDRKAVKTKFQVAFEFDDNHSSYKLVT
jgi:hypothetical protein